MVNQDKHLYYPSYQIDFGDGDFGLFRDPIDYFINEYDVSRVVREGETLNSLAFDYYGNDLLWFYILEVNPQIDIDPETSSFLENLEPGSIVIIPDQSFLK
jgi:nucleoid-associated protein YgaU